MQAQPELTAGVLFRHLQTRTPGRYQPNQVRSLQLGLRVLRANLGKAGEVRKEAVGDQTADPASQPIPKNRQKGKHRRAYTRTRTEGGHPKTPLQLSSSLAGETSPLQRGRSLRSGGKGSVRPGSRPAGTLSSRQEQLQSKEQDHPLARAVQTYLCEQTEANRSPKTLAWHRVALGFLQRYLYSQQIHSLHWLTRERIQNWITWLQEMPGGSGPCAR